MGVLMTLSVVRWASHVSKSDPKGRIHRCSPARSSTPTWSRRRGASGRRRPPSASRRSSSSTTRRTRRKSPRCPARSAPARGPARPAREAVRFRLEHFEKAAEYKVRFIVHERPLGLIGAKRTGADAARGGIIVFFVRIVAASPARRQRKRPSAGTCWYGQWVVIIGARVVVQR